MGETIDQLRAERDRYRELYRRAVEDCTALGESLTEAAERLELAHDAAAAWDNARFWEDLAKADEAELEVERRERDALIRIEVERLSGRTPKPRGRPPSWSADGEAEVERMHRGGASIRQIAATLHASKTQVHRVITRVHRQQAEVAERGRLMAIATGRSLEQRAARAAKQTAERHPIEDYDQVRAERYRDHLRNLPDDDD